MQTNMHETTAHNAPKSLKDFTFSDEFVGPRRPSPRWVNHRGKWGLNYVIGNTYKGKRSFWKSARPDRALAAITEAFGCVAGARAPARSLIFHFTARDALALDALKISLDEVRVSTRLFKHISDCRNATPEPSTKGDQSEPAD